MTELNIVRRDHTYFHGWVVCVKRRGQRQARYFSDRPGGRAAALRRARAHRDKLLATLPPITKIKSRYVRNTTGTIGVSRIKERTRQGKWMIRYAATWPSLTNACRSARATFSIAVYGEAGAKRRAIRARRARVAAFLASIASLRPVPRAARVTRARRS